MSLGTKVAGVSVVGGESRSPVTSHISTAEVYRCDNTFLLAQKNCPQDTIIFLLEKFRSLESKKLICILKVFEIFNFNNLIIRATQDRGY